MPFRWAVKAFKRLSTRRKVYLVAMVLLASLPAVDALHGIIIPQELIYQKAEAMEFRGLTGDRLDRKIAELKAEVLDTLAKCESGGNASVAIVFDSNEIASIGTFQWQPHSFQYYYEKKNGINLTEREAIIKALDDTEARALASYVVFETEKGGSKDWFNCFKWHSLNDKVKIIHQLEN